MKLLPRSQTALSAGKVPAVPQAGGKLPDSAFPLRSSIAKPSDAQVPGSWPVKALLDKLTDASRGSAGPTSSRGRLPCRPSPASVLRGEGGVA